MSILDHFRYGQREDVLFRYNSECMSESRKITKEGNVPYVNMLYPSSGNFRIKNKLKYYPKREK